ASVIDEVRPPAQAAPRVHQAAFIKNAQEPEGAHPSCVISCQSAPASSHDAATRARSVERGAAHLFPGHAYRPTIADPEMTGEGHATPVVYNTSVAVFREAIRRCSFSSPKQQEQESVAQRSQQGDCYEQSELAREAGAHVAGGCLCRAARQQALP